MAIVQNFNFIEILKRNLQERLRRQLNNDIMEDLIEKLSAEIYERLWPLIEEITINEITSMKDMSTLRDEFKVYVAIHGENSSMKTEDKS